MFIKNLDLNLLVAKSIALCAEDNVMLLIMSRYLWQTESILASRAISCRDLEEADILEQTKQLQ